MREEEGPLLVAQVEASWEALAGEIRSALDSDPGQSQFRRLAERAASALENAARYNRATRETAKAVAANAMEMKRECERKAEIILKLQGKL